MSLESVNYLPPDTKIENVYWVIEHLGYEEDELEDWMKGHYTKCFFWRPPNPELTYVGVELYISIKNDGNIVISTRTRMGRNHLELSHQNTTTEMIHRFFGGTFESDGKENEYLSVEECSSEKSEIAMALHIQWNILNNALTPVQIFNEFIKGVLPKDAPAGHIYSTKVGEVPFVDFLRPCVVSVNIQLPYIIGAWENYLKNSYLAIFKYISPENKLLTTVKFNKTDLERIRIGENTVEECVVEKLSFQRPHHIIDNFENLDKRLDVNKIFNAPYKDPKKSLSKSINKIVNLRNKIVHEGYIDTGLTEDDIKEFIEQIMCIAKRFYELFAKIYDFDVDPDL